MQPLSHNWKSTKRLILPLFAALSLAACVRTPPIVTTPPARCADLIPQDWQQPVDAAPVPSNAPDGDWLGKPLSAAVEAALIAPWANAYVAQDGALAKANGRTADAISIFKQCEVQVNAARPK